MNIRRIAGSVFIALCGCPSQDVPDGGAIQANGADAGQRAHDAGALDSGSTAFDAGALDSGSTAFDAGSPVSYGPAIDVVGGASFRWIEATTVTDVPIYPQYNPIIAYSISDGGFVAETVLRTADGGFQFHARSTPYYLALNRDFVIGSSSQVDLGFALTGRPDQYYPGDTGDPRFIANISGLLPMQATDTFEMATEAVQVLLELKRNEAEPFDAGTTYLNNNPLVGTYIVRQSILEASRYDLAVVSQKRFTPFAVGDAGLVLSSASLITSGGAYPIDVAPGVTSPLYLVMTPVAPKPLTIDWRGGEWVRAASSVHARAVLDSAEFLIIAVPGGTLDHGFTGYMSELFKADLTRAPAGRYDFSYGNPKPSTWPEIASLFVTYSVQWQLPGTTSAARVPAYAVINGTVASLDGQATVPSMIAPHALQLDGVNAQGETFTVPTTTPVLKWTASPRSTSALVTIHELYVKAGGTVTRRGASFVISSKEGTQLRLPPGTLSSGSSYVIEVSGALRTGPYSPESAPFRQSTSETSATALTSLFTVQ